MPNALTLETMSPGLLKVGETRSPEPHRRKSRMREIRLSGSGEGLGWATSQPTLQRPLPLAACPHPIPCPRARAGEPLTGALVERHHPGIRQ
jgi:hypothetical protein